MPRACTTSRWTSPTRSARTASLATLTDKLDEERQTAGNRVFYLATPPPAVFETVVSQRQAPSAQGWARLIIEKPFGHDLARRPELQKVLETHFAENEIFQSDHYLGKETVQNMMALRFANGIFRADLEPAVRRPRPDHGGRVDRHRGPRPSYYERAGAIRDIFQNHLLQLRGAHARWSRRSTSTADSVRNEKVKVLRAMHTPGPSRWCAASTGAGYIEGEEVPAYRGEAGVAPGLADGDLRRREAVRRQLALG